VIFLKKHIKNIFNDLTLRLLYFSSASSFSSLFSSFFLPSLSSILHFFPLLPCWTLFFRGCSITFTSYIIFCLLIVTILYYTFVLYFFLYVNVDIEICLSFTRFMPRNHQWPTIELSVRLLFIQIIFIVFNNMFYLSNITNTNTNIINTNKNTVGQRLKQHNKTNHLKLTQHRTC